LNPIHYDQQSQPRDIANELRDFTAGPRLLLIAAFAIAVGVVSAFVAKALLALIGFFTNLFFFHRVGTALVTPESSHIGPWVVLIPVAGALIIGVMARYGSDRIRGHGIPEAIEAILINGSRVDPKVAVLKPLSSAISIGSGGPFGAEGPIIMTGGAIGSLIAQFLHLTSAERKTLLVAGAAAGMSATFAAPMASVLLAVELLLFEWKPRSVIPVSLASVTAAVVRRYIIGLGPLFPLAPHPPFIGPAGVLGCVLAGLLAGGLSVVLTQAVYAAEDAFEHVPIHWMWWPAIGGLVIGIGGWIFPPALGVGYDVIGQLLQSDVVGTRLILGILIVKAVIWAVSLGSGTSGGVLAPLLMMGGALGAFEGWFLPAEGAGFWPLVSMGAVLGGTMRSPFTAVIFAVELTHDVNMLLPLLVAATVAHGFTVLVLKRSILTEKIARRGYHVSREYSIDPLEILFVREVMRTSVVAIPADAPLRAVRQLSSDSTRRRQRLYPVVDEAQRLVGVVTGGDLQSLAVEKEMHSDEPLAAIVKTGATVAFADESLRMIAYRMAETGLTEFPVVNRQQRLVGMIGLAELLKARSRNLEAEERRERVFGTRVALLLSGKRSRNASIA
jgi:chloride channel protein, CIC family